MEVKEFHIKGPLLITPKVFSDDRGYFTETFKKSTLEALGIHSDFFQDNQSLSQKNVLRGLHFQEPPHAQGKFVRVLTGKVMDVIVDIRKNSPTYGEHLKVILDAEEKRMLWVPEGFAHGFLTLENNTLFLYKCTNEYNKESENGLMWNDPKLNIDWGLTENPLMSEKDLVFQPFENFVSKF